MFKKYINSTSKKLVATTLAVTFVLSAPLALIPSISTNATEEWLTYTEQQLNAALSRLQAAETRRNKALAELKTLNDKYGWFGIMDDGELQTARAEWQAAEIEWDDAWDEYRTILDGTKHVENDGNNTLIEAEPENKVNVELSDTAKALAEAATVGDEDGMKLNLAKLNEANTERELKIKAEELIDAITSGNEDAISAAVTSVNEAAKAEDEADEALLASEITTHNKMMDAYNKYKAALAEFEAAKAEDEYREAYEKAIAKYNDAVAKNNDAVAEFKAAVAKGDKANLNTARDKMLATYNEYKAAKSELEAVGSKYDYENWGKYDYNTAYNKYILAKAELEAAVADHMADKAELEANDSK